MAAAHVERGTEELTLINENARWPPMRAFSFLPHCWGGGGGTGSLPVSPVAAPLEPYRSSVVGTPLVESDTRPVLHFVPIARLIAFACGFDRVRFGI